MESLLHHLGHLAHVLHQKVVLDDGARDTDGVTFLKGVQADGGRGHLTGDDHHGNAVHVRGGDAGDRVGDARARGDERHAHLARGARVAVGGVHRGLLVAHQHVLDAFLLEERVVDGQHGAAGVTPDVLDAFGLQGLDEDFRAAEFLGGLAGCGCGGGRGQFGLGDVHDQPFENFSDEKPWVPLGPPLWGGFGT